MSALSVAIIGAGQAGLCSAKRSIDEGFNVIIFEQCEHIGGIWHYTDKTGKDLYGDVHTAMYQGLRANAPFQALEYPNFPYPDKTTSYPSQADVLNYLHSYADHFDLKKYIKFNHLVIRVAPSEDKWEIVAKNLLNNTFETNIYNVVFICNGHYSVPRIAEISGAREFKGKMIHSHDFRTAEAFRDQSMLVIGSGPSGLDLVDHLSKTASRVTFSQRKVPNESQESRAKRINLLPRYTQLQDEVKCFTPTGAQFFDGSHQTFDAVIYATGYIYSFRFLSADCGIYVEDNFVQPLYKQILNIQHPSMAFISLTSVGSTNYVSDMQVRFALQFITGKKKLPSKSEMLLDMRLQAQIHWNKGYSKDKTHFLGPEQTDYCKQLAETADIQNMPEVLLALFDDHSETFDREPYTFRRYKYTIIDKQTFEKVE